jgi:photosystem II stability/assembly factor-like uncharacterized protein
MSPAFARDRTMWVSMTKTGVYRSRDGGETWERASEGLTTDPQADEVKVSQFRRISVAANAGGKNVLFAAGFDGLFRSDDEAARWVSVETLADYVVGLSVSPDFEHDSTIAVATYVKGAYLSTQDGATWHRIDNGLRHELSEGNEFAPIRRLHNITFSPDYAQDRTIFSASWTAFLRSTDSGDNWETIRVNPESPASELQQFVLGVSPAYSSDHTLYLGTRVGDLYRSASRGDAGSWTHLGSLGARVRSFAFDPSFDTRPVMFAGTVEGVRKSVDGGDTWRSVTNGPEGETQIALSPDYRNDHTLFAGTERGLFVSRDEGETWRRIDTPVFPNDATIEAVALSPDYARDQMVLVSVSGTGLFRSTDGGSSFSPVGTGLLATNHIIADFSNPSGKPIQFSPSFARDRTIFAYAQQDVLRSTDGGETWTTVPLPSAMDFLRDFDPSSVGRYEPARAGDASSRSALTVALIVIGVGAAVGLVALFVARRSRRARVAPS